MSDTLPDGVHLELPAPRYFEQDAIGSTDLIKLFQRGLGWWWQSKHNPRAKLDTSEAATYGSALHAIVLEGVAAYEARFAVEPERKPGMLNTIDEMKAALRHEGFRLGNTTGWRREDWLAAMRVNMGRVPVWENIYNDWKERVAGGREPLSKDEDWSLRLMASILVDETRDDNEEVRLLFAGDGGKYPPLAEVSVFLTLEDGVRRRWRLDRMFPRFDMDLKSMSAVSQLSLRWSVGDLITNAGYDIQRADYFEGREVAYQHIAAGRVFGGTSEQRRWLARFPQEFPSWDWVWLFYQKPDPLGRAPIVFPVWDDSWEPPLPGIDGPMASTLRAAGAAKAAKALRIYRDAVAKFGLDRPWARVEPVHYTDDRMEPHVNFPPWIHRGIDDDD